MKASATLFGTLLIVLVLAIPAFAVEDGIIDTSSSTHNEDSTHADFERVITNVSEDPVDVAPRDLRMAEYPTLTVTEITVGTFDSGIWTIGTLDAGQTAAIAYAGDTAPTATTTTAPTTSTTEPPATSTTVTPTTTAAPAVTATTAPEELPHTGQRDHLAALAFAGLALIGLGISVLRATRD